MLQELEVSRCRGDWAHPRTVKHRAPDVPERGSGLKNTNTRKSRAGYPLVQEAGYPLGEVLQLRVFFPGGFAQHSPPWWSRLCKLGHQGRFFLPTHGIFLPVLPTSTSYSCTVEQLGSASKSQCSCDAKRFSNSYARGS